MLTIVAVFFILNLFVISPVLYIFLNKLFSGETLPYKKSLTLCVQLLSIGLFIESIILAVHWYAPDFAVLVSLLLNLALFVLSVAIVKSKLDTTIGKAIAIQILAGVFAVVITFTFRNYVCQAYKIPSGSNAPTLLIGDLILVNKYIYKFGQPEIKLGIIPGWGGTQRLPRLIGEGRAMWMILTGEMISAQQAHEWGLVDFVVPQAELEKFTFDIAEKIAAMSPLTTQVAKEAVKAAANLNLREGLELESRLFALLFSTEDKNEGVTAFLEKRTPNFKGK